MSCVRGERFIGPGEGDEKDWERGEAKSHAVILTNQVAGVLLIESQRILSRIS
jgi:hypothetical protein